MANIDIYGKNKFSITHPITADQVLIHWGGGSGNQDSQIMQATNIQLQYTQQVTRRYALGTPMNAAVVIPGRPIGNMTIGRLFVNGEQDVFNTLPGFNICEEPATITLYFGAGCSPGSSNAVGPVDSKINYIITGAYVTGYSLQADADTLNVVDNLTIEFLQLEADYR